MIFAIPKIKALTLLPIFNIIPRMNCPEKVRIKIESTNAM
jgi:hypothetical protein